MPATHSSSQTATGRAGSGTGHAKAIAARVTPSAGNADTHADSQDGSEHMTSVDETATRYEVKAKYDAMEPAEVWRIYRATPSRPLRNYLMEKYLPLVRFNAERIYARLPDEVDVDDLVQAGLFGLIAAIEAFDLERGVKFETYCAQRIKGAILDELRATDWVPRLVRQRTSKVEGLKSRIEKETGRRPTDDEITEELGAAPDEITKILRDSRSPSVTSLSRERYQSDGSREVREIDVLEDGDQINPLGEIQRRDLKTLLTKGLTRAERLIVTLYYYEEMTMKEIGQTLALSESRVSQMHSSILLRLKAQMQHREREFDSDES
jgi:RNA polymerase sigma factor for flagellar operon FliA